MCVCQSFSISGLPMSSQNSILHQHVFIHLAQFGWREYGKKTIDQFLYNSNTRPSKKTNFAVGFRNDFISLSFLFPCAVWCCFSFTKRTHTHWIHSKVFQLNRIITDKYSMVNSIPNSHALLFHSLVFHWYHCRVCLFVSFSFSLLTTHTHTLSLAYSLSRFVFFTSARFFCVNQNCSIAFSVMN